MSFVARFERTLEGFVNTTFARLFRSEVKPVELRSALERELDNTAQVLSRDSALAPNTFVVELSPSDHSRLAGYGETLSGDLAKAVEEHAQVENYTLPGRVQIDLRPADDLSTGRFRVTSKPVSGGPRPQAPKPPVTPRPTPSASWGPPPTPPAPTPTPPTPKPAPSPTPSDPTVARPLTPWLEVNGAKHELIPPGILIGRGSEADLQVIDPGVSRRHAEIRVAFIGRRYTVTLHDLGSTNGTLVDGTRASFSTLAEGSAVTVGNTVLTIHIPSPARS
ncbi:MAG TPA: DUF3662 and FHA domain-containing protein [Actinopolymorphaceae bacterium]